MTAASQKSNLLKKAIKKPEKILKLIERMKTEGILTTIEAIKRRTSAPLPLGYTAVGRVIECGKDIVDISSGDCVVFAGDAYHAEINCVGKNLVVKLPNNFPNVKQASLGALGSIALHGIHQAEVIPGETVAVIGMGLIGQIVARLLNAYGCTVVGYDISDRMMPLTKLSAFVNATDENAEEITKSLTNGRGVDKVIITASASNNSPMDLGALIARERAIMCMIGVTQMNIDRRLYYQKELTFKIARSYGPGRYDMVYENKGNEYPIGYVRFTLKRNLEEFIHLIFENRVDFSDLITHEFRFADAKNAYELLTTNKAHEHYLGIVLKYSEQTKEKNCETIMFRNTIPSNNEIKLGLIGAGTFSRGLMLPAMKNTNLYHFYGLATSGGASAAQLNEVFPFDYLTNNYHALLNDPDVDLIAIATRHNSHAKYIIEALNAGKHVYCEKPLCLTLEQLNHIEECYKRCERELFVGLNRRHSPYIKKIKKQLSVRSSPVVYDYLVNAGSLPYNHWVHDHKVGGGRIRGEACHYIDTIQYLDGSALTSLNIEFAHNLAYSNKDNAIIHLQFASGSIANIIFTSMGANTYSKEQLIVMWDGKTCQLDNYVKLQNFGTPSINNLNFRQDKGFENQYQWMREVIAGKTNNNAIGDALLAHRMLISAVDS
jgi:predicted dehydrogenase/threonine dehydrogenase-like Zn-dependent dehydrogenase